MNHTAILRRSILIIGFILIVSAMLTPQEASAAAYASLDKDENGNPVSIEGTSLNGITRETKTYTDANGEVRKDITISFANGGPTISGRILYSDTSSKPERLAILVYGKDGKVDVQAITIETLSIPVIESVDDKGNKTAVVDLGGCGTFKVVVNGVNSGSFTHSNINGKWEGCGVGVPVSAVAKGEPTHANRAKELDILRKGLQKLRKSLLSAADPIAVATVAYRDIDEFIAEAKQTLKWSPEDKAEIERIIADAKDVKPFALEALGYYREAALERRALTEAGDENALKETVRLEQRHLDQQRLAKEATEKYQKLQKLKSNVIEVLDKQQSLVDKLLAKKNITDAEVKALQAELAKLDKTVAAANKEIETLEGSIPISFKRPASGSAQASSGTSGNAGHWAASIMNRCIAAYPQSSEIIAANNANNIYNKELSQKRKKLAQSLAKVSEISRLTWDNLQAQIDKAGKLQNQIIETGSKYLDADSDMPDDVETRMQKLLSEYDHLFKDISDGFMNAKALSKMSSNDLQKFIAAFLALWNKDKKVDSYQEKFNDIVAKSISAVGNAFMKASDGSGKPEDTSSAVETFFE